MVAAVVEAGASRRAGGAGVGTALWVVERAAAFWRLVGEAPPFPREIEACLGHLQLIADEAPGLRVATVRDYLAEWDMDAAPLAGQPDFALHACLVTISGRGVILLDADDPPDERRFSVAHELAHFLRDAWAPRQAIEQQLGSHALAAFDQQRPPTTAERLRALLAGVGLTPTLHLMARDADARIVDAATARAEREADELACELLAPEAAVWPHAGTGPPARCRERLAFALHHRFGLPARPAAAYAARLVPDPRRPSDLLRHLQVSLRDDA